MAKVSVLPRQYADHKKAIIFDVGVRADLERWPLAQWRSTGASTLGCGGRDRPGGLRGLSEAL
jgi:hypothetical protein